jgi:hypothetical protein
MGSDEMQNEIAPLPRQPLEFVIFLHGEQRAELMPILAKDRLIDWTKSLGKWTEEIEIFGVPRRVERTLPARRFLAFIVKASTDCERVHRIDR